MIEWYPPASKMPLRGSGLSISETWRGVLHTTEGSSAAGAFGAYQKTGNAPQFTATYEGGHFQIWQHMPITQMATALAHPAGTIDTNRLACVQIELVGFAAQAHAFSTGYLDGIRAWMAWVETQTGILAHAPGFLPYPQSAGRNPGRMSDIVWTRFNGWCGHQHVPNNDHGDPGNIDIGYLLQRGAPQTQGVVKPMYDPPLGPIAAAWLDPDGKVISAISPDGKVFWGKWWGNVAGKDYWGSQVAAGIGARPDGQPGYRITATDGAVYDLPDGRDKVG